MIELHLRQNLFVKRLVFLLNNRYLNDLIFIVIILQDCELLENDICSQEYAIAKKHHLLGRVVHFPNCSSLPKTNCFELGIEKPEVNEGKNATSDIIYN